MANDEFWFRQQELASWMVSCSCTSLYSAVLLCLCWVLCSWNSLHSNCCQCVCTKCDELAINGSVFFKVIILMEVSEYLYLRWLLFTGLSAIILASTLQIEAFERIKKWIFWRPIAVYCVYVMKEQMFFIFIIYLFVLYSVFVGLMKLRNLTCEATWASQIT